MSHIHLNDISSFHLPYKMDNYEFYSCSKGREILNHKNFPPDIIDFLKAERQIIHHILIENKNTYDALLEIGCGEARNITLSSMLKLKYFGIDFIKKEILLAKKKIERNNFNGKVKCLSVLDLNHASTPIPKSMRTIALFPFNVFGNIFEPIQTLQTVQKLNYDMMISTYRNDVQISAIFQYYTACGLNDVEIINLDHGTMFLSKKGFKSIIYSGEYMTHIAQQIGLTMDCYEFSKLGKLYYLTNSSRSNHVQF
jgi:hypothetical protein